MCLLIGWGLADSSPPHTPYVLGIQAWLVSSQELGLSFGVKNECLNEVAHQMESFVGYQSNSNPHPGDWTAFGA